MERRDKKYYSDISLDELFDPWIGISIAVIIVAMAIYSIIMLCVGSNHKISVSTIATNEAFNELSQSERQVIADWNKLEVDEDFLMEVPSEADSIKDVWFRYLMIVVAVALTICSALVFAGYCDEKLGEFFLADLPFATAYGWFLFFAMYAGWIVLAISAIRMKSYFRRKTQEEQQKALEHDESVEEVTYEDLNANHGEFDENSLAYYVKYADSIYQRKIKKLKDSIKDYEEDLCEQGDEIRRIQYDLAKVKAELNELKEIGSPKITDREMIETLEAIKAMRGVVSMNLSEDTNNPKLIIDIHVRIPYKGETYDGGDYKVEIAGIGFNAVCVRPGTKSTWPHGKYPDYRYESERRFCFGTRAASIQRYLTEYQLREAIILIVDCLHSTGDQKTTAMVPSCFRRIVPPSEKED